MQAEHLVSVVYNADKESAKKLCDRVDEKVDSYANGDLDRAVDAITLLWKLSKEGGRSTPASPAVINSVSQPSLATNPSTHRQVQLTPDLTNWRPVKIALIRSIREGIFFDRKYWARDSKSARGLRPLYISSIATGECLSHIDSREWRGFTDPGLRTDGWAVVKLSREDECLDADSGTEDSDCESDPEQASESAPEEDVDGQRESERESLPVLTIGSFARYAQRSVLVELDC